MKKRHHLVLVVMLVGIFLCGCVSRGIELKKTENLKEYIFTESTEWDCMQLEFNGKVYLPYCSGSVRMCDDVIGYYNHNEDTIYVLSCKDLSQDEWIIDCIGDVVNGHNIGGLWREQSVTTIPESIHDMSEYEWNKELK